MTQTPPPEEPERQPPQGAPELPEAWTRQDRGGDNTERNALLKGCGIVIVVVAVLVLGFIGICSPAWR